jgi:hypothetical protein
VLGVREDEPTHHMLTRSRPMFQDLWRRKQIISLTFSEIRKVCGRIAKANKVRQHEVLREIDKEDL